MNKAGFKSVFTDRNILVILIATVGILPALICYGGYYINGDITTQMLPFVYETKRMLSSGIPFWSWNTYFGDNFIASYAYYTLFNPFTWINCLFPYKYIGVGFTIVLYLKFLLCRYVTQKYLRKIGFDDKVSLIGSILYTFSSWAITNLYYYMFMEPMILFPFLLIFIERFLRTETHAYSGLAIATFVVVVINYYFASINLIAAAIYLCCRLFCRFNNGRSIFLLITKAAGCVSVGILCASVVIIPVLTQLMGSPYQATYFNYLNIYCIADRFFWLLFPKIKEGATNYLFLASDYTSHAVGIAVFGLLPAILLFMKKGYGWIKWFTGILTVLYLTPLNGIFSLFTQVEYTRSAFVLTLSIVICTIYYFKDFGLPPLKYAVWYCCMLYGAFFFYIAGSVCYYHLNDIEIPMEGKLRLCLDALLVAINLIALLIVSSKLVNKHLRYTVALSAVSICASVQLWMFSYLGITESDAASSQISETEYFRYHEDFRCDEDFHYRTNFSLMRDYGRGANNFSLITNCPSIETFHSVQNVRMQKWNNIVNDKSSRYFQPLNFTESFEALMSVRKLVLVSGEPMDTCSIGEFREKNGRFYTYESDHYIPMGFSYDKYVISEEAESLTENDKFFDIPKILLSTLAIDKEDEMVLSQYLRKGEIDNDADLDSLIAARSSVACDSFTGHSHGFDAHICLESAAVVFFSVLADKGFKAYIDGKPTKIFETNLGFSSVIVPAGNHDIAFRYFPPGLMVGGIISIIGFAIIGMMFYKRK